VLARGLDEDLPRAGVMVLAISGAIKDRIHGAAWTPRPRLVAGSSTRNRLAPPRNG